MLKRINFVSLVLVCSLFLIACGGDDGGGNGDKKNPTPTAAEKPVDPWAGVGSGELAEDSVTHAVRGLTFGDGMTIGYDGTGRDEVVCRGGSDSDGNYEVCVSLDDDPYYIAPEVNFLVLHPLMFDRFGSYPECWTWAGDEAKRAADCRDVFVRMGGRRASAATPDRRGATRPCAVRTAGRLRSTAATTISKPSAGSTLKAARAAA